MKRFLLLPAAAMLAATPVSAQNRAADPPGLACVAWAAITVGAADDDADMSGMIALLGYFIGTYEGATGRELSSEALIELIGRPNFDANALEAGCMAEAANLGARMSEVGQAMMDFADGGSSK
jgi:hypothetical protein